MFGALTITLVAVTVVGLRTPVGRVLVTVGSALFAGFIAGHGWWTGIGNVGLFLPGTNIPTPSSLIWLLLLPMLAWGIFRVIGAAVSRTTRM